MRRRGFVELPPQSRVDGQLGCDLPLVLHKREELPLTIRREILAQVATRAIGQIQQKTCKIVVVTRRGAVLQGRLSGGERVKAARTEGLVLQQIVAQPA